MSVVSSIPAGTDYRVPDSLPAWLKQRSPKLTELRTSAAFDVVGSVDGPQTGSIRLDLPTDCTVNQVLWCMSSVDLVHQCTQLVLDSVLHRYSQLAQCSCWSAGVTHGNQDWAPDGQQHSVHVDLVIDRPTRVTIVQSRQNKRRYQLRCDLHTKLFQTYRTFQVYKIIQVICDRWVWHVKFRPAYSFNTLISNFYWSKER